MSSFECPHCANKEVRKVSAIYSEETWSSTTRGYRYEYRRGKDRKIRLTPHSFTEHHTGATRLAQQLAPPASPVNIRLFFGLFVSFLLLAMLYALYLQALQPLAGSLLGWLAIGAVLCLLVGYMLPPAQRYFQWSRKKFEQEQAKWQKEMQNWEKLYYCPRCDLVFHSETKASAPSNKMRSLL